MKPRLRTALALGLVVAAGAAAFALRPRPQLVVAVDQAFAAIRPGLVELAGRDNLFGNRIALVVVPVDGSAPALLRELETRRLKPAAIAASPLLARALVEGAARNGSAPPAPVLALEWEPPEDSSARPTASIISDPIPAARRLGASMGAFVSRLRSGSADLGPASPSAQGAAIFEDGEAGNSAEREAFVAAWTAAAGFAPLVLDLDPASPDNDSPLRGLFSSDLRTLFIDEGADGPAALDLADGRVAVEAIASGAAQAIERAWPNVAFVLSPDDRAILRLLRSPRAFSLRGALSIPSTIEAGPAARSRSGFTLMAETGP